MKSAKIEKIRKAGLITKGAVYALLGILTFMAAINVGGKIAGKNGVVSFLQQQTFGNILLIILAIGLLGYAVWRVYAACLDPKNKGSDEKGYAKRIGYLVSGILYATLSVSTFLTAIGEKQQGGSTKQQAAATILDKDYGQFVLFVIAIILFGVAVYQFYKGASKKFLESVQHQGGKEEKEVLEKSGLVGYMARGVAFGILGWFVFKAASENDPNNVGGMEAVFGFLSSMTLGNVLMGAMALGLVAYGVFQYFLARYSRAYS
ncbi:MAG: DUF1206 domain-containing protein [Thermonemataceae bacterium]